MNRFSWPYKLTAILLLFVLLFSNPGFTEFVFAAEGDSAVLDHYYPPPGFTVAPGASFQITFYVRNTGTTTWSDDGKYWLQNLERPLGANIKQYINQVVPPENVTGRTINMVAPTTVGHYNTVWRVSHSGQEFGDYLSMSIAVGNTAVSMPNGTNTAYLLLRNQPRLDSFVGVTSGPVTVRSFDGLKFMTALQDTWSDGSSETSFSQVMGLPASKASTKFYFPAYDNVNQGEELVFANVGTANTNVSVVIGEVTMDTFAMSPGEMQVASYDLNDGPVLIKSSNTVKIIAALKDTWSDGSSDTSYSQIMGLPAAGLSTKYFFPGYDNVDLAQQLVFTNLGVTNNRITVSIAGVNRDTYTLAPKQVMRKSYAGVDNGPVVIKSLDGIKFIAAEQSTWSVGPSETSFHQLMGLPAGYRSLKYYFPSYDNVNMSTSLVVANVGGAATRVKIIIGGEAKQTFTLQPGKSIEKFYPVNKGPVLIKSIDGVKIIAAQRNIWLDGAVQTSYAQLMGLSGGQLSTKYYFPAYDNINLEEKVILTRP